MSVKLTDKRPMVGEVVGGGGMKPPKDLVQQNII